MSSGLQEILNSPAGSVPQGRAESRRRDFSQQKRGKWLRSEGRVGSWRGGQPREWAPGWTLSGRRLRPEWCCEGCRRAEGRAGGLAADAHTASDRFAGPAGDFAPQCVTPVTVFSAAALCHCAEGSRGSWHSHCCVSHPCILLFKLIGWPVRSMLQMDAMEPHGEEQTGQRVSSPSVESSVVSNDVSESGDDSSSC